MSSKAIQLAHWLRIRIQSLGFILSNQRRKLFQRLCCLLAINIQIRMPQKDSPNNQLFQVPADYDQNQSLFFIIVTHDQMIFNFSDVYGIIELRVNPDAKMKLLASKNQASGFPKLKVENQHCSFAGSWFSCFTRFPLSKTFVYKKYAMISGNRSVVTSSKFLDLGLRIRRQKFFILVDVAVKTC